MTPTSSDAQDGTREDGSADDQRDHSTLRARELNVSDAAFELFREQTSDAPAGRHTSAVAAVGFLLAVVLLLVALEAGADLQQLLLAAIALAIVNVVTAIVWSARSRGAA